jgi:hypothetical protein
MVNRLHGYQKDVAVKHQNVVGRFRMDKSVRVEKSVFCAVGEEKSIQTGKFGPKSTMTNSVAGATMACFVIFRL